MGHWGTAEQQLPWLVWKRHRVIQRMLWCSAWYRVGSSVSQKRNQKGQEAKCCCSKAGNDIVVAPIKPSMSSAATQRPTKVICEEQNPKAAVWQEREKNKVKQPNFLIPRSFNVQWKHTGNKRSYRTTQHKPICGFNKRVHVFMCLQVYVWENAGVSTGTIR